MNPENRPLMFPATVLGLILLLLSSTQPLTDSLRHNQAATLYTRWLLAEVDLDRGRALLSELVSAAQDIRNGQPIDNTFDVDRWRRLLDSRESKWTEPIEVCSTSVKAFDSERPLSFKILPTPLAINNEVWLRMPPLFPNSIKLSNLVDNGAFERERHPRRGMPVGRWTPFTRSSSLYTQYELESIRNTFWVGYYPENDHNMAVIIDNGSESPRSLLRTLDIRTVGQQDYLIAAKVLSDQDSRARFGVAWFRGSSQGTYNFNRLYWEEAEPCTVQDKWTWYVHTVKSPKKAKYAQIWAFNYETPGQVYVDDVIFVELP